MIDSQIDDIDLKLARTDVKSTVDGVISVRNARIGAIAAGAGNPLFTIIRDNAVELDSVRAVNGDRGRQLIGHATIPAGEAVIATAASLFEHGIVKA